MTTVKPNAAATTRDVNQQLLDALKLYLGIDPADTSQDAELAQAILVALSMVELWLDRVVAKREVTEHFQHYFGTVILHNLPVEDPVTVTVNGSDDTTSYSWYQGRGGLAYLSRTGYARDVPMDWRNFDQVDVVYTAGYDPLPVAMEQGIVWVAADIFKSMGTGSPPGGASGAVKKETIVGVGALEYDVGSSGSDGGAVSGSGAISATAAQLLYPYRRVSA